MQLNPELPLKLEEVINKALEKDRELRCQTASELKGDLKRLRRDLESSGKATQAKSGPVSAATHDVPATATAENPWLCCISKTSAAPRRTNTSATE